MKSHLCAPGKSQALKAVLELHSTIIFHKVVLCRITDLSEYVAYNAISQSRKIGGNLKTLDTIVAKAMKGFWLIDQKCNTTGIREDKGDTIQLNNEKSISRLLDRY